MLNLEDNAKLRQISMDGVSRNWKFLDLLNRSRADQQLPKLLNIGSCSLHIWHSAFITGSEKAGWEMKCCECIFSFPSWHYSSKGWYLSRTGCSVFPLYFCATERIEDSDAAKRLISIWQNIVWLCAFMRKWQGKQPSWKSFLKVQKAVNDKLIVAKLQFFSFIGDHFKPFLTVPNWCSTDSRFVRWFKKTFMSKSKSHQEK